MAYSVEFTKEGRRQLDRLDKPTKLRIARFIAERLETSDNPRTIGEALKGEALGELWKYRVGAWRIVASIKDDRLIILVVKIGHRREVYR